MGSSPDSSGRRVAAEEMPQHHVAIKSFAVGKYEVTQGQWLAVMGKVLSDDKSLSLPVQRVTWYEVHTFIAKLNQRTGLHYRLPTEAEWEYAARANSATEFAFGNDDAKLGDYAWFGGPKGNSGNKRHPVGGKLPNPFGIYDIYGNVSEWVEDCYTADYEAAPGDGTAVANTACVRDEYYHAVDMVFRGGSAENVSGALRSASRRHFPPDHGSENIGFRLARTL